MMAIMAMMQVMEWMDLERNAAILEKTDKAIAQKLRAASGGKVIVQSDFCSQVLKVENSVENLHETIQNFAQHEKDNLTTLLRQES